MNEIIEKNDTEELEKFHIAKYKLLKNKDMEKCCVCLDFYGKTIIINSGSTLCEN